MTELFISLGTAFWLGILTSISPCPMATNIAAISFIGKQADKPKRVLITGLLYTAGRTLAYMWLGIILVSSLLNAPGLSHFMQKYINMALGPLLILVGMVLLELLNIRLVSRGTSMKLQAKIGSWGLWAPFFLGILFALSFCPVSAALFFGSLLPIAVKMGSGVWLPMVYGIATGLPVLAFAIIISLGTQYISKAYNNITIIEKWGRLVTGTIFILVGIYLTLVHVFGVNF